MVELSNARYAELPDDAQERKDKRQNVLMKYVWYVSMDIEIWI